MPLVSASAHPGFVFGEEICDIRGWTVRTLMDGEAIGVVRDLMLDGERPRYIDIELAQRSHILAPVGLGRADRARRLVWLAGLHGELLGEIPPYTQDPSSLTRAFEISVLRAYDRAWSGGEPRREEPEREDDRDSEPRDPFYDGRHFSVAELFGTPHDG